MPDNLHVEITRLRKEGRLEEALTLAVEVPPEAQLPLKVAVAWLFYDLAKGAQRDQQWKAVLGFYSAYMRLEIPAHEELLHKQFARFAHFDRPWALHYELADEKSRMGLHAEAIAACREIAEQFTDFASNELYGWVLWRFMKEQTAATSPDVKGINEVLDLYMELDMPKPSRLHSTMLRQVIKLVGKVQFNAYKFMYHWGWQNFRPEDLERYTDEKGLHYSLLEKAMHRYGKVLSEMLHKYKNRPDVYQLLMEDAKRFLPLIEGIIAERPDNPWMPKEREKVSLMLNT